MRVGFGRIKGLTMGKCVERFYKNVMLLLQHFYKNNKYRYYYYYTGFPSGSGVKNLPGNAGDTGEAGLIPGSERSHGGGNGNSVPYYFLKNSRGQRNLVGFSP